MYVLLQVAQKTFKDSFMKDLEPLKVYYNKVLNSLKTVSI